MNTLNVVVFACLAVATFAYDDGQWHGHGVYNHYDNGLYHGEHAHALIGHGVAVIGPVAGHAIIAGPAHGYGHGYGGAYYGGYGHGYAHGHGHGVVVKGPATVPATIVGPSGKIHAEGLYGIGHGSHGYGHHY